MKKEYAKPYVLKESFQLDAAIAGSCSDDGYLVLNHYRSNCTEAGYFASSVCDNDISLDYPADSSDDFCYHGPLGTGNLPFLAS